MTDRFDLEGTTYYQQHRKCGKDNCATCQSSAGHGPYWYARDWYSGKVAYVGKDLPEYVSQAREQHRGLQDTMVTLLRQTRAQVDALTRLLHHSQLDDHDRQILHHLGLGAALVTSYQQEPLDLELEME